MIVTIEASLINGSVELTNVNLINYPNSWFDKVICFVDLDLRLWSAYPVTGLAACQGEPIRLEVVTGFTRTFNDFPSSAVFIDAANNSELIFSPQGWALPVPLPKD